MSRIIYEVSMSLDGFIAASGMTAEEGLGVGGEALHDWYFAEESDPSEEIVHRYEFGAFIAGRRTYDNSIRWWGPDGHGSGTTVIVSHDVPAPAYGKGVYTFMPDIDAALDAARAIAGNKDIRLMGGSVAAQYLHRGLVDEIALHVVPILLGTGLPLFGEGPVQLASHVKLEQIDAIGTPAATHLYYRVVR